MHENQRQLMGVMLVRYARGEVIHDIGSYDVNGSHRGQVEKMGKKYIGVDISPGPNVDLVVQPYSWEPLSECETIISGSCLEHVEAPWLWAAEAAKRLRSGGRLLLTAPFSVPEHRYPVDCYRYLPDGMKFLFGKHAGLTILDCGIVVGGDYADTYVVCEK